MATQTIVIASFDAELVRYEADWDDVTNLVTALRCVNNSGQASSGRVWLTTDTSRAFPPGSGTDPSLAHITAPGVTETRAVPTGAAQRLQLTVVTNPRTGLPRPSNLDGEFTWPVS